VRDGERYTATGGSGVTAATGIPGVSGQTAGAARREFSRVIGF
jgi:hypothetical protein